MLIDWLLAIWEDRNRFLFWHLRYHLIAFFGLLWLARVLLVEV